MRIFDAKIIEFASLFIKLVIKVWRISNKKGPSRHR